MQRLKTLPSRPVIIGISIVALAATLIIWLQFPPIESRLKSAGYGIVDYELAFTADRADAMLAAWGPEGRGTMRDSLLIDFPFMLSYALAFAAGAMIYVVIEELIPESQLEKNTDIATMGAMFGFAVMMTLDVALG